MKQRQRQILGILHQAPGYVTAEQLAMELHCSERTIRSDIGTLRTMLAEGSGGRLEAKGNQGYRLEIAPEAWERLLLTWESLAKRMALDTQLGGKYLVLERVLKRGSVTAVELEQDLFTSYKNVKKYVDQAEEWLVDHGVAVQRRRGHGTTVCCPRHQVRLALWALYREMTLFPQADRRDELLESFWREIDLGGIRQIAGRLERKYQFRFSYDSYERFCFLLAAMLADSRKKLEYRFPGKMEGEGTWEWEAGRTALDLMREYYRASLANGEAHYLWFALSSSEVMDFLTVEAQERNAREKQDTLALVRTLVGMISDILQRNLAGDRILENGLLHYLSALVTALRWGDRTSEDGGTVPVKTDYADVCVACWSAVHLLEDFLGTAVTKWEMNMIAVHFAGAVERMNVGGAVYVVCNYGVGVSRFLCEQLKRAFPRIQVLGELTPRDLGRLRTAPGQYDLLITTVDLPDMPEATTVRIGNYLHNQDVETINKKLSRIRARDGCPPRPDPPEGAYPLFSQSLVLRLESVRDKQALLHKLCRLLVQDGCVTEEFEASVLERELHSSTALSHQVAIPHGLPEHVRVSRATVALLDTPVKWNGVEQVDTIFLLAFNFKSDANVQQSVVGFYKGLIALLNEPERLADLHALPDAESVAHMLNTIAK